jgi:Flp pilus assembly protein TadB
MRFEKGVYYCITIVVIIIGITTLPSNPLMGVVVIILGFIWIWFVRKSGRVARIKRK